MPRTLPSWSDGPTRDAIIAFATSVSSGPDAVPEAERIAVFDNDGTLWTEKPMPTQLHFIVQQWKAAVDADPSLAERQPYRAAATGDLAWLGGADGPEKPIRIWSRIGRRPLFAAGNSNGDVPMLRYVQGHPRSLSLLVHHDDDTGRGDAPYDTGAEEALAAASDRGFTVVSVKRDWSTVFPEA
jgi:hypothetical protein